MQYTSYSLVNIHMNNFTHGKHEAAYLTNKKGMLFFMSRNKVCMWAASIEYLMHSKPITYSEEFSASLSGKNKNSD